MGLFFLLAAAVLSDGARQVLAGGEPGALAKADLRLPGERRFADRGQVRSTQPDGLEVEGNVRPRSPTHPANHLQRASPQVRGSKIKPFRLRLKSHFERNQISYLRAHQNLKV